MPQISQIAATYASQIFWLAIVFGLIYFVIGRGMVPKIIATVDARDAKIAGDLAEASRARAAADATEEAWRQQMAEARAASQAETAEARSKAAADAQARVKAADVGLNAKLAEAEAALASQRDAAKDEIEIAAADAAQELVARLSGAPVTPDVARDAVRKAMAHG